MGARKNGGQTPEGFHQESSGPVEDRLRDDLWLHTKGLDYSALRHQNHPALALRRDHLNCHYREQLHPGEHQLLPWPGRPLGKQAPERDRGFLLNTFYPGMHPQGACHGLHRSPTGLLERPLELDRLLGGGGCAPVGPRNRRLEIPPVRTHLAPAEICHCCSRHTEPLEDNLGLRARIEGRRALGGFPPCHVRHHGASFLVWLIAPPMSFDIAAVALHEAGVGCRVWRVVL
mmetsp:Transcript_79304/g.143096  ORF Transcript_79304/g.143096 Transcript_79304/m.143096 type:complete len:231 (+) Transcript_79304:1480-2172(+)